METLRKRFPSLDLDDLYVGIFQATNMTGFTSWYPWNIFYQCGIEDFDFESITIFYRGNGSGKTTLLNVIAQKLNLQRSTLSNRSVRSQLRNNQAEQSNGETAFNYFVNAIKDNTLILLDEPENSLSAQWQMELALFLQGAIRSFNCQLIIASHSSFILSIPGARIYNLDVTPIEIDKWYNLNNIRCYFDLFKQHEAYFEK